MKTTIDIADALLHDARRVATEQDTTLRALVEEGLRLALAQRAARGPFCLRDASFRGQASPPLSWEEVRDALYEGRGA